MLQWLPLPTRRLASLVIVSALTLSGCAMQQSSNASLTPVQQQLRAADERFDGTVATGAVVGALAGAALGALVSGPKDRGKGALIGAAAGGATGAGAGYMVASNNAARSRTEANLNQMTAEAQQDAADLRRYAALAQQLAQQAQATAAQLDQQYRNKQITAADYRSRISEYSGDAAAIRKRLDDARVRVAKLREDAGSESGANRSQLLASASDIEASQRQLADSLQRTNQVLSAVPQA